MLTIMISLGWHKSNQGCKPIPSSNEIEMFWIHNHSFRQSDS